MSDATWTITSSKRKSNDNAQQSRKRVRISEGSTNQRVSRKQEAQQTLTQIAFVHPSSSEEDDDNILNQRPPSAGSNHNRARAAKPPRILKRDSTLTQMDFLDGLSPSEKPDTIEGGSSMRPPPRKPHKKLKKRDSTLTQMDFFNMSMDGATDFDDTMLPELDDTSPVPQAIINNEIESRDTPNVPYTPNSAEVSKHPPLSEDQKSRSTKRKEDQFVPSSDTGKRRRSSRIAAAMSPQADSSKSVKSYMTTTPNSRRGLASTPKIPLLEIQDSTDFLEVPLSEISSSMLDRPIGLSTPTKSSRSIPSSQTPESIRRSIAKRPVTPSKGLNRRPLSEISTNIRRSARKTGSLKAKPSAMANDPLPRSPFPRKVCILKLSPTALASFADRRRVKSPEHDVYSLQPTSPSAENDPSPRNTSDQDRTADVPAVVQGDRYPVNQSTTDSGPTIKETASSLREIDSQQSLPDIADVLGLPRKANNASVDDQTTFGIKPTNMIPELLEISSDGLSDLGSPVRNDTQFVRNLHERLSSPGYPPRVGSLPAQVRENRAATVPVNRGSTPSTIRRFGLTGSAKRSPLPAPELVFTSPVRKVVRQETGSSNAPTLPSLPTLHNPLESVKISFLPLNDTAEYHQTSSSPSLPSGPLSATEKHSRPASIPHPSQVSTQAPSQGYFPSSSAPQNLPAPRDSEIERITIKDSSSIPPRLSQIVKYPHDTAFEGELDMLDVSQDENDAEDLDLDPSTFQVVSKSAEIKQSLEEDITQTPTQKSKRKRTSRHLRSSTQSSPVVLAATTRSQRDAKLDVVALTSSSSPLPSETTPTRRHSSPNPHLTPTQSTHKDKGKAKTLQRTTSPQTQKSPPSSSLSSSLYSPSPPRDLKRKYGPLPGFDNDTQSDYTQGGHVTAAYVHRMWDRGDIPTSFVPKPYKVKNFRPSMRKSDKGGSKSGK